MLSELLLRTVRRARSACLLPQKNRCRSDRHDRHHERQDRGIEVRVNQEQASKSGADEQGDEYACKSPPFCNSCRPVRDVARKEYDGRGRSSCKDPFYMKPSNSRALHPHRERPRAEEHVGHVSRGLAVTREPDGQEDGMRDQ